MTPEQLKEIGRTSSSLDWTNPKAVAASIEPLDGTKRFVVLWKAQDGNQRVYGFVGGVERVSSTMSRSKAELVRNHLLGV